MDQIILETNNFIKLNHAYRNNINDFGYDNVFNDYYRISCEYIAKTELYNRCLPIVRIKYNKKNIVHPDFTNYSKNYQEELLEELSKKYNVSKNNIKLNVKRYIEKYNYNYDKWINEWRKIKL